MGFIGSYSVGLEIGDSSSDTCPLFFGCAALEHNLSGSWCLAMWQLGKCLDFIHGLEGS